MTPESLIPTAAGAAPPLVDRARVRLLVVDDEEDFREAATHYFARLGYPVKAASDGGEALALASTQPFDVAIIDIHMPHVSGLELLSRLREQENDLQAIMLTGGGTIANAVQSMKQGAFDFLTKPARLNELDQVIQRAWRARELVRENRQLRHALRHSTTPGRMIGQSVAMQEVRRLIDRTAPSDKPVLIEGESGTGKELVARAIHEQSPLADKPLVVINCAALPEPLLESELFGHEKGAFTGAIAAKAGLFEIADGGTLFIDEFGELAGSLQAKLLRVLEDGSLRRIGSVKTRQVRVRLIAATNRNLAAAIRDGSFREDLYYRVNVLGIRLPPLRERRDDIPLLVRHFLGEGWTISDELLEELCCYSWPGNIRQLYNALERAKILAASDVIERENLPPEIIAATGQSASLPAAGTPVDLESLNRLHVEQVYERHGRNKSRTARALGIGRRSLYRLLEKYGLE